MEKAVPVPDVPARTLGERARRWFDRALVVGLLGLATVVYLTSGNPVELVLSAAQITPLWWRRRRPALVLAAVVVASAAQLPLVDYTIVGQLAFPVAVYSAARWAPGWVKASAVVVTLCAAVAAAWSWTGAGQHGPGPAWQVMLAPALSAAGIALTAWALGLAGSQRDRTIATLRERAEQARRMAERDVALAAQDERARIAREMHDVVAHGLSVIVVQADGARYAAAKDPQVAVDTLETIAATGRGSLAEMRRLLGLLRTGDSGVRPQPVLADVEHLVEEARAGGMDVEAELPDDWPDVGEGAGLAAYRVVQEALTNVRKHAGPGVRVRVRVEVADGEVRLQVRDDGRGASAASDGSGLGLRGMRERVGVHGGTVTARPAPGGGWSVGARIPL